MATVPERIRALSQEGVLEIRWPGQAARRYPFKLIRCDCPCASCVHEFTGERLLQPESVPDDIAPVGIDFVGNYALRISWSDGHASGIFSWDHLDRLAESPDVLVTSPEPS